MTKRAILAVALATAVCGACAERNPQVETTAAQSPQHHSSGGEHHLPHAEQYAHRLDDPSRDAWQKPEQVVEMLDCQPGETVVDLGAGTGYFLSYLSEAVGPEGRVLALDIERSMVERMYDRVEREKLRNVRPDTIMPNDPALTPRSVDTVLVVNTWHHIEDRVAYAKKLGEALRPNGAVWIVDFNSDSPIGPPEPMRLTVETVAAELDAAGLETEVVEETLPYQYVVVGRLR
jgi:predicted methyltransferase